MKFLPTITALLFVIIMLLALKKSVEKLTNTDVELSPQEKVFIDEINKTVVLKQFQDITPVKLYEIFNNDLDYISTIMVKNNIPPSFLKNTQNYPKIATFLFNRGVLKYNK